MEDDKRFSYFFLGLGLGVALGVLFAPKSGEETRGLIREKANEGTEYLRRRSVEVRESASGMIDRGKQSIARQKEQIAAAIEAGRQAYRETVAEPDAPVPPDEAIEGV
jgi:gas vesicle protein